MNAPVTLNREECLARLVAGTIGRVAFNAPGALHIVPVNYVVHGDSLVIRTSAYAELAQHGPGHEVAFEIDQIDVEHHAGWSVVLTGRLERMSDERVEELRDHRPEPWAAGQRNLLLELPWREISGRRLGSEWDPLSADSEPRMR